MNNRFEPRKRTALDGKVWWCVYDTKENRWSTYLYHGKYRTKKDCIYAILSEAARSEMHRYSIGDVFTVSDDKGRCMTYRKINNGLQLIAVHGM